MKFKVAFVLLAFTFIISLFIIPSNKITPSQYCLQQSQNHICIQCYTEMLNQTLSSRTILKTREIPFEIGYVTNCIKYNCEDILQLLKFNGSGIQFQNYDETNKYIQKLGLKMDQQPKISIVLESNKSIITFSNNQLNSSLSFIFEQSRQILTYIFIGLIILVLIFQFFLAKAICRSSQNKCFNILVLLTKIVMTILIGIYSAIMYQEYIQIEQIIRKIIIIFAYIGLIYILQTNVKLRSLSILSIIGIQLCGYFNIINSNIVVSIVTIVCFVTFIFSTRIYQQTRFTKQTRNTAQLLIVLLSVSEFIIQFISIYLIVIALIFTQPNLVIKVLFQDTTGSINHIDLVQQVTNIDTEIKTKGINFEIDNSGLYGTETSKSVVEQTDRIQN